MTMTSTGGRKYTNRLGIYGTPEKIRIHKDERIKYPTEVTAAKHIFDPDAPAFVPAPIRPLEIWCSGCHRFKLPEMFHRSNTRPNGRQPYCKACRKAGKKHAPMMVSHTRWYRAPK